jgi:hypothetical protein
MDGYVLVYIWSDWIFLDMVSVVEIRLGDLRISFGERLKRNDLCVLRVGVKWIANKQLADQIIDRITVLRSSTSM